MGRMRQLNIEGAVVEIPLVYDELAGRELEQLPDFIANPVCTPEGCPILFTGEDACEYGEAPEGAACIDCGSCRFYRQAPGSLIGVCGHEKKRQ